MKEGKRSLHPRDFNFFSDQQYAQPMFQVRKFDEGSELDWVEGVSLLDQSPFWVPAHLAFLRYGIGREVGSSNGLACHQSLEKAQLSGLLELVERDVFMFCWWTKTPILKFDLGKYLSTNLARGKKLRDAFGPWLDTIEVGVTTFDHGIPTVIAKLKGKALGRVSGVVFAAAARPTIEDALEKAILELFQCSKLLYRSLFRSKLDVSLAEKNFDESICDFNDGVQLFLSEKYEDQSDFLMSDKPLLSAPYQLDHSFVSSHASSPESSLEQICDRLAGIGCHPISVDLTPRNIKQCGLSVVRTIAPPLIPLNAQQKYRAWGLERIFQLKKTLGLSAELLQLHDLNPLPHPFP